MPCLRVVKVQTSSSPMFCCHPDMQIPVSCRNFAKALCPLLVQKSILSCSGMVFSRFFNLPLATLYSLHSSNKCFVSCLLPLWQKHLSSGAFPIVCWNDLSSPFPVFNWIYAETIDFGRLTTVFLGWRLKASESFEISLYSHPIPVAFFPCSSFLAWCCH